MAAVEIFTQTVREKGRGAVIAAILLLLYVFWIGTMYPEISKVGDLYTSMLENPAIKAFIGDALAPMTQYEGFLSMEVFSYMGLVLGGYVAFMTASFIAGEIEHETSELLLSLPIKRETIVLSRYAVLVPVAILLSGAISVGAVLGAQYINESINMGTYLNVTLFLTVFILATASISLFISSLMSDSKQAALASLGVFILMYFMNNIGGMVTSIDAIRSLCLFHYMDMTDMLVNGTMDWGNFGVLLLVAVVFLVLSVIVFKRREINTV
ncbi:ABC transporter permease [Methanooceanicella nereidis]|nr:ABC transporter permease subunit [Methanocella sp. CWC-04]